MANNKVVFGNETIMDITDSTVTPENLLSGETAYDASGQKITGNVTVPTKLSDLSDDATHRLVTDTEKSTWNGKISDNPTFSQASSRANIESGESFATILGKIKKWYYDLKTVAFTGKYSDLSGTPTIPTVNDASLIIQRNGVDVQTFSANSASNKYANIQCEPPISWTNDGYWKYYKDTAGYYHMFYDAELTLNFSTAYKTNVYIPDVWHVNFPKSLSGAKGIEVTTRYSSDIMGASIHSITSSKLGVWFWRCNSGSIKFGVSISLIGW